jgi:hypothetical protein
MAKGRQGRRKAANVHPHVLAVLRAVWHATAGRPVPYYVSVDSLGPPDDLKRNGAAILLAVLSDYLTAGGDPPHSIALTEDGRRVIKAETKE